MMPRLLATTLLAIGAAISAGTTVAKDDPILNAAFQDHIAYVATFAMPVLIDKCGAMDPAYTAKAAPLYFRYVNARQDQIERGRLLTLAELAPGQTLKAYREQVLASRLGALDTGAPEQKAKMCEGALGVLSGASLPGEWPSRASANTGSKP